MPDLNFLIKTFNQAVKNVKLLRFAWILIATICILALVGYFHLKDSDVFVYSLAVLGISFLTFLVSLFLKKDDPVVRIIRYALLVSIAVPFVTISLRISYLIGTGQPFSFKQLFQTQTKQNAEKSGDTVKGKHDSVVRQVNPKPKTIKSVRSKTYFMNFDDPALSNAIETKLHLRLGGANAENLILLTYTNMIDEVDGGFVAGPGFAEILVNGKHSIQINEYPISKQYPLGQLKLAKGRLDTLLAAMPIKNVDFHTNEILKYLNQ